MKEWGESFLRYQWVNHYRNTPAENTSISINNCRERMSSFTSSKQLWGSIIPHEKQWRKWSKALASLPGLPTFDHLQYPKLEVEGPFYYTNDISVYPGRQRREGSSIERMSLRPFLVVFVPSRGFECLESQKIKHTGQDKEHVCKMCSFDWGLPPSLVYLGRHWHWHVMKWTRSSLSIFAYCKQSETRRWEGG